MGGAVALDTVGTEKVWLSGVLRYQPNGEPMFTADIDRSLGHEGDPVF